METREKQKLPQRITNGQRAHKKLSISLIVLEMQINTLHQRNRYLSQIIANVSLNALRKGELHSLINQVQARIFTMPTFTQFSIRSSGYRSQSSKTFQRKIGRWLIVPL